MPIIQVTLLSGYDDESKRRLATRLTNATMATIAARPEGVTVALHEVVPSAYMRAGRSPGESNGPTAGRPRADGPAMVRDFLAAMQRRDLDAARAMLAPEFEMVFPGPTRMRRLEELLEWARPRYRSVGKRYESFEECFGADDTVVWCYGTLHGEWLDGSPFEGIRFVDRFRIREDRFVEQMVWNDLAETRSAIQQRTGR